MTLTVAEMWAICVVMKEQGKGDWPISVAFSSEGREAILSDIVSAVENGKTLQLNEEELVARARR